MKRQRWQIKDISKQAEKISAKLGIEPTLVNIILNRGVKEDQINSFLYPSLDNLFPAKLLPEISKAKKRINQAILKKEKVMVLGDYDVDGVTSLAVFNEFSKKYPDIFSFYIPDRVKEGYGLSREVVSVAKQQKKKLIIAFDCGTNSCQEIKEAKKLGIDVIVVDHHLPQDKVPKPVALINPKIKNSRYPFLDLTAAGLAFKLLQFIEEKDCYQVLDLVALSIVCDVAPLLGENRILLKEGINYLRKSHRPAIKALCQVAKINQLNISNFHIGYILGPRINASGRIAHANDALELFLTEDLKKAKESALQLNEHNKLRKNIQKQILKEAEERVKNDLCGEHALVVGDKDWHPGVLGIVASRLKDRYRRPSIVVSFNKGIAKGSGRSVEGVHLMDMLDKCSNSLTSYGGHKKAVGMELEEKKLDLFRQDINLAISEDINSKDFIPTLIIDAKLNFRQINTKFIDGLSLLYPYGEANPKPIFLAEKIKKKKDVEKIKSRYCFWLTDGRRVFETISYNKDLAEIISYGKIFDLVFSLEKDNYHNHPRLILRDCRLA